MADGHDTRALDGMLQLCPFPMRSRTALCNFGELSAFQCPLIQDASSKLRRRLSTRSPCGRGTIGPAMLLASMKTETLPSANPARRRTTWEHSEFDPAIRERRPWNAGRMVGAKRALKPQQVWAIRFWLDRERRLRDRALFDLAIDSKLRGCDVVKIRIGELVSSGRVRTRATVTQRKTGRPVQFELLEAARSSLQTWLERRGCTTEDYASRAALTVRATSALGSMPDWWMNG